MAFLGIQTNPKRRDKKCQFPKHIGLIVGAVYARAHFC
jgi:hypothetical protein